MACRNHNPETAAHLLHRPLATLPSQIETDRQTSISLFYLPTLLSLFAFFSSILRQEYTSSYNLSEEVDPTMKILKNGSWRKISKGWSFE
ncbi:hypothetical protein Pfo_012367 [Paulownia fortunei]|nr:hypothetical protein Pfo_012367 [Paulownia fortunei]